MINTNFVLKVSEYIEANPPERLSETYLSKHIVGAITYALKAVAFCDDDDDDDWRRRRRKPETTGDNWSTPEDAQIVISCGGSLYVYDRTIWRRIDDKDLKMLCLLYDGKQTTINDKPTIIGMTDRKAKSIATLTTLLHTTRRPNFFDEPPIGLAFTDGFWTIEDGSLECVEHHPKHKTTFGYGFPLDDEDQPVGAWLKYLDSLWRDDEDKQQKIDALQEWIGATLIGRATSYARAALFIGTGANGKSVLQTIIEELFPPQNVTTASPAHWHKDYTLASLQDSRLNVCSELPEYRALDTSATFKAVLSGDRVEARLIYRDPFSFRPIAGHLFAANALPNIGSGDFTQGFFRRFLLFTFNRNFKDDAGMERRDQQEILEEIRVEHASILWWALHGACRLLKRGEYTLPASHELTIQEWHQDSDPVQDFIQSCCKPDGDGTLLKYIYDDYVTWCESVGRKRMTNRTLAKRLRQLGINQWRGNGGTKVSLAVKMKTEWLDYA